MQTTRKNLFTAVRTEGGLLPADLLQRIARGDTGIDGVSPEAYHLAGGEKLNEAISRSWNHLLGTWEAFSLRRRESPSTDAQAGALTSVTREKWLLPLFQELGYGRLLAAKEVEIEGKPYPVSHQWQNTPIHLIGCGLDIDRRTPGAAGAARMSPHGMVQELLNRHKGHLWGIVTNGLRLRLLRDNVSLTRQAYVEFDLEAIMDGEVYSDFILLWLLCHQSRVEGERPELCWLEKWTQVAQEQGTRVLDQLRVGVEQSIAALGAGFLAHPANSALKEKLRSGTLGKQGYYHQLLRMVYRTLFLFVAEDRALLLDPKAPAAARQRYTRWYSTLRLRQLAIRHRGTDHSDLWQALRLLFRGLSSENGCPDIALPPLGSFLWSEKAVADLMGCELRNRDLLTALRVLAVTTENGMRRAVDFRSLDAEELGSVYESLLELHPDLNADSATFTLSVAAGHERKTTGSYYTPTCLVTCLLDSALDPVLDDAVKGTGRWADGPLLTAEQRILSLKVCDWACGSGHFVIAAARRIAKRLAAVRTGDDEPSPEAYHAALRDVISHCIYAVDINPMAVELCKVNLWLEALEPGKPLSFLDHHVQCGNSLLGATPALLAKGIPDDAFSPIEGDDKAVCTQFKKQNKDEHKGQQYFFDVMLADSTADYLSLTERARSLDASPDDNLAAVHEKERSHRAFVESHEYRHATLLADAWCAAFIWKKTTEFPYLITEGLLRRIRRDPDDCPDWMRKEIARLSEQYQFFHPHLAFPDVFRVPTKGEAPENEQCGWNGGFDVNLGNPPWVRQELLKPLKQLLVVFRSSTSTADSSVYFVERNFDTARLHGRVALLTPNKWFRASYGERLRQVLRDGSRVHLLVDFGHSRNLFPDADTFPAAVVLEPTTSRASDTEPALFVRAYDCDRQGHSLGELIREHGTCVPHAKLRQDRWQFEEAGASALLDRLMGTGRPLASVLGRPIFRGLLSGLNEAFYVDTAVRDDLIALDPSSVGFFRKLLRGRDIKRWTPRWDGLWHIVIPSSQNHTWLWSPARNEVDAEAAFARAHPSVHAHLKPYEERLRERQDRGTFWWELRACDYYAYFDKPKVVVQCIAYYSQFALDPSGHYANNKAIVIPTDDLYVLAILNSRVTWWIVNRTFQHMKDEGLSVDVQFLRRLPIPNAPEPLRMQTALTAKSLVTAADTNAPTPEVMRLEAGMNELVLDAFSLTKDERQVLLDSLPPRDPLAALGTEKQR